MLIGWLFVPETTEQVCGPMKMSTVKKNIPYSFRAARPQYTKYSQSPPPPFPPGGMPAMSYGIIFTQSVLFAEFWVADDTIEAYCIGFWVADDTRGLLYRVLGR